MCMSALYFLPLTMPRRVGVCLSLKFRVTSYTAVTVKCSTFCWERIETSVRLQRTLCLCASVLHLCPSDTAAWWWSLWFVAEGDTWARAGLYSLQPACWFGAFSLWIGFPHSTAETAKTKAGFTHTSGIESTGSSLVTLLKMTLGEPLC